MKKKLFLVALAGLLLAGCVKSEVADQEKRGVKVSFDSPVLYSNVNSTKANVYGEIGTYSYEGTTGTYTYPREENFVIFGVQHVGNLTSWADATPADFNGQPISYDSSLDAWAPLKSEGGYYYWPDGKLMSFAAMSPADLELAGVTPTYSASGLTINDFVVNDEPTKQYDLLFSERTVDKSAADMTNSAEYYSGIPLLFKHALSSIHFSLLKEKGVTESVHLLGITLKNAVNKGSFNENITNETAYASQPVWTVSTDASDKSDYVSFSGSVEFPLTAQYVSALAAADGTEDGDISHPLLLLPQNLSDDMVLEIKYEVGEEVKTKTVKLNEYPKGSGVTPITTWNVGTRYTYRLIYGVSTEVSDIIYFSPSTDGWVDVTGIEVLL